MRKFNGYVCIEVKTRFQQLLAISLRFTFRTVIQSVATVNTKFLNVWNRAKRLIGDYTKLSDCFQNSLTNFGSKIW